MSIVVNQHTRVLVQGLTSDAARFHTAQCMRYGTRIVAAVAPGCGGSSIELDSSRLPVFDTVTEAVRETAPTATIVFEPPALAADAILEAADAGLELIVTITKDIPVLDMVRVKRVLASRKARLIGPNCAGIITPGACKLGVMPDNIYRPGSLGVISRSNTLAYEAIWQLTQRGIGQSTCIDIGSDPIIGSDYVDLLAMFANDPGTTAVLLIAGVGGSAEQTAARWIKQHFNKPVAAFVPGVDVSQPRGMGHAEAILSDGCETAAAKIALFKEAGVSVAATVAEISQTVAGLLA